MVAFPIAFPIIIFVLFIVVIAKTVKVVPQQQAWVVERFGRYHATLQPGLSLVFSVDGPGAVQAFAQGSNA